MDPTCAYAYTLSGHESIDEDLDKAINFFQTALRADPRHYNAWYVHRLFDILATLLPVQKLIFHRFCKVWPRDMLFEDEQDPPGRVSLPQGS